MRTQLVFVIIFATVTVTYSCQVHLCYTEYKNLASGYMILQQKSILRSINSHQSVVRGFCQSLESYNACMKGLGKSCRGSLNYHAVIVHVKKWIDDYNCTGNQKIRSSGKNLLNLALRQQSERQHLEYPWTGSSSISDPQVKRKVKRRKKHRQTQHRSLQGSDESAFSSSSTSHPVNQVITAIVTIALISVSLTFT